MGNIRTFFLKCSIKNSYQRQRTVKYTVIKRSHASTHQINLKQNNSVRRASLGKASFFSKTEVTLHLNHRSHRVHAPGSNLIDAIVLQVRGRAGPRTQATSL
jgi:hypothetical protein